MQWNRLGFVKLARISLWRRRRRRQHKSGACVPYVYTDTLNIYVTVCGAFDKIFVRFVNVLDRWMLFSVGRYITCGRSSAISLWKKFRAAWNYQKWRNEKWIFLVFAIWHIRLESLFFLWKEQNHQNFVATTWFLARSSNSHIGKANKKNQNVTVGSKNGLRKNVTEWKTFNKTQFYASHRELKNMSEAAIPSGWRLPGRTPNLF